MKNYDPNISFGVHTVRVTLQRWDYVGHLTQQVHGNCKGSAVLDFDFELESEFPDNDCNLSYDEDRDCFSCVLHNDSGDTLSVMDDSREMNKMIVCVEILDYQEEDDY